MIFMYTQSNTQILIFYILIYQIKINYIDKVREDYGFNQKLIHQKRRKLVPAVLVNCLLHQMFRSAILVNSFCLQFCRDSGIP